MKFALALVLCLTGLNSPGLGAEIKVISVGTVSPVLHELGSRLIKSTIPGRQRDTQRRDSYAPAYHSGLRCA
jgi:hypothetical protein